MYVYVLCCVCVTAIEHLQHGPSAVLLVALAVFSHVQSTGVENGFVSFSQQQVVTFEPEEESQSVILPMQRTGGTSGTITVFVIVS